MRKYVFGEHTDNHLDIKNKVGSSCKKPDLRLSALRKISKAVVAVFIPG